MEKITKNNSVSASTIIAVRFFSPVNGRFEFFFGSLAAIYQVFSAEQIGATLRGLWSQKIGQGESYCTATCIISKHTLLRIRRKNSNFANEN